VVKKGLGKNFVSIQKIVIGFAKAEARNRSKVRELMEIWIWGQTLILNFFPFCVIYREQTSGKVVKHVPKLTAYGTET
jgi:hypothetical protein